jgi:hypothetical protein
VPSELGIEEITTSVSAPTGKNIEDTLEKCHLVIFQVCLDNHTFVGLLWWSVYVTWISHFVPEVLVRGKWAFWYTLNIGLWKCSIVSEQFLWHFQLRAHVYVILIWAEKHVSMWVNSNWTEAWFLSWRPIAPGSFPTSSRPTCRLHRSSFIWRHGLRQPLPHDWFVFQ